MSPGPLAPPFVLDRDGAYLELWVTPNAARDQLIGTMVRDDGHAVLRLKVRAVPEKGKANQAVIAFLSKKLDLPKGAISITRGETGRQKRARIDGEPDILSARLTRLCSA